MHEAMQPLMRRDDFEARPQIEMKGIAEHDFGADWLEILRRHRLDRAVSADRHERRRLHGAARKCEPAAPRRAIARQQFEAHGSQAAIAAVAAAARSAHARSNAVLAGIKNIASP